MKFSPIDHLRMLNEAFVTLNRSKYMEGQKEHGDHLWELPLAGRPSDGRKGLLEMAREEVLDQWNYIETAITNLRMAIYALEPHRHLHPDIARAYAILAAQCPSDLYSEPDEKRKANYWSVA